VASPDKKYMPGIARDLQAMGFGLVATPGTKKHLDAAGIEGVEVVHKIQEKTAPNILDLMARGEVRLVINTPSGKGRHGDEARIREQTITLNIPCITTIPAARAAIMGIRALKAADFRVQALQDYFPR